MDGAGSSSGGPPALIDLQTLLHVASSYQKLADEALAAGNVELAAQYLGNAQQVNQIQHLISGTGGGLAGLEGLFEGFDSQPPPENAYLQPPEQPTSASKGKRRAEEPTEASLLRVPPSPSRGSDSASDGESRAKKQRLDASGSSAFTDRSRSASPGGTPSGRRIKVVAVASGAATYPVPGSEGQTTADLLARQRAAIAQMQAAMMAHRAALAAAGGAERPPTYVNPKQYARILKRREARKKWEKMGAGGMVGADGVVLGVLQGRVGRDKTYIHESRHRHAVTRPRGPGGRFLTAEEMEQLEREKSVSGDDDADGDPPTPPPKRKRRGGG
ncbi:CCAAT-binding transcription factor (CBF-B/NF-YA) subunit B-domain-containing protein [Hyaloraphidium curvatum]|nr:CCAAT-binding transcription factor (CBF-B/NF-YA) subunit B-domain-containing protein [Hyaloraphidium curvatum]